MTTYTYANSDDWSEQRLTVFRETTMAGHPTDTVRVSVTDVMHACSGGEGASIVIPRDRVPDLIAALQQFMEETK